MLGYAALTQPSMRVVNLRWFLRASLLSCLLRLMPRQSTLARCRGRAMVQR